MFANKSKKLIIFCTFLSGLWFSSTIYALPAAQPIVNLGPPTVGTATPTPTTPTPPCTGANCNNAAAGQGGEYQTIGKPVPTQPYLLNTVVTYKSRYITPNTCFGSGVVTGVCNTVDFDLSGPGWMYGVTVRTDQLCATGMNPTVIVAPSETDYWPYARQGTYIRGWVVAGYATPDPTYSYYNITPGTPGHGRSSGGVNGPVNYSASGTNQGMHVKIMVLCE